MKISPFVLPAFALLACVARTQPATSAETPDAAAVKKHLTTSQLELGDPMVNSIGMLLVPIPAGEFLMGSPGSDSDGRDNEKPHHLVAITKPFYLSVFEVTQQQYEKVMGVRPWQGKDNVQDGPDYPATWVNWNDAVEFCRKLSETEGVEYRLPTEAQWEYSCRAGSTSTYSFGNNASNLRQYAWYRANAWEIGERYAHQVGQKLPNSWGLYDMPGNVWEFCHDWYNQYPERSENALIDPSGPASSDDRNTRVLRGGSFFDTTVDCRSAFRIRFGPEDRYFLFGFRVARSYP